MSKTTVASSSELLARLEKVNWLYGIQIRLHSIESMFLVKYVIEENAYGLMLTDFSNTYFECLMDDQIEAHYTRYNRIKCGYKQILQQIDLLLKDLRTADSLNFEKLIVECCTPRITIKSTKMFEKIKFNWNFYVCSTQQDVFMQHCSIPMLRGLVHFYRMAQNKTMLSNDTVEQSSIDNDQQEDDSSTDIKQLFAALNDASLAEMFR